MSEHKAIFRSASVISFFTILSRATGFVRDVLLANIFGTGLVAQAFFVAFRIPNVFRDILGEGAGNAAFVPVFCEYLVQKSRQEFLKLVNSLMSLLLVVSSTVTILGMLFTPFIVQLIAPGFYSDVVKFTLTVNLTRMLFPYLVFIALSAYLMSVSNALKSFAMPAASSIASNIVFIIGIMLIGLPVFKENTVSVFYSGYYLAVVALIAGISQFLIQVPPLSGHGINFKKGGFSRDIFKEEGVRKVGRLIVPRILGTSIYQLNIFVDTIFASLSFFVGDGAIAAIYYANRIVQFPFAIFGVALSNAALPTMSSNAAKQDIEKFKAALRFSLKTVFLGVIPLTAVILSLSHPLVRLIFERGRFDQYSTSITSTAVFFYALGLVFYVGVRFFSSGFYAMQDTITPVKMSILGLILNVVFISIFVFLFRLKIAGLALASSISAGMNFFFLYWHMRKRIGFVFGQQFRHTVGKVLLASLLMGLAIFVLWHVVLVFLNPFLRMCVVTLLGAVIYCMLLIAFRVRELKEFVLWLQKK